MKFKNYRNPQTNRDEIYSRNNMLDMSLRELINREDELLAQTRVLGIPEDEELSNSENAVYVDSYTRDDGTEVKAHWRSKPDSSNSSIHQTNTDFDNTDTSINTPEKYSETEEYKIEYRKLEKQKSIERKDPDEIAGVKRGEPKTFFEMMQRGVNPNYQSEEDLDSKYSTNCQSCNVACELVMRGYDIEANSYENPIAQELSRTENSAYFDPHTGNKCIPEKIDLEKYDCVEYINKNVNIGGRYEFSYHITPEKDNYSSTESHTVFMTRMENDKLLIYDGQNGEIAYGNAEVKSYINSHVNNDNTVFLPSLLRVDDKRVNPYYTDKVVRASGKSLKY